MKKQFTKRILSWFLAAVMTLGMVVPMGAANTSDGAKTKETNLIVEKVDNDAVPWHLATRLPMKRMRMRSRRIPRCVFPSF